MDTELERLLDAYTRLCLDIAERERARDAVKQQISNLYVKNGQTQEANSTPLAFTGHAQSVILTKGPALATHLPSLGEALEDNPGTSATELAGLTGLGYGKCISLLNGMLVKRQVTVDKSRMPYRWRLA